MEAVVRQTKDAWTITGLYNSIKFTKRIHMIGIYKEGRQRQNWLTVLTWKMVVETVACSI